MYRLAENANCSTTEKSTQRAVESFHVSAIESHRTCQDLKMAQHEETAKREKCFCCKSSDQVYIDQTTFRHVLATFGSGVTVLTFFHEGHYFGMTASSFCSLSLDPPLILVCIDQRSQCHDLISEAKAFVVNILAEGSEWLASQFARRNTDKFANVSYHKGTSEIPLLDEALATIECQLVDHFPGGDHGIFIGKVVTATICNKRFPLLYYQSQYHRLAQ